MADHYAVLGLAPYAEHSAVRAAYLTLMRRYHPDINASEEAAARAREVTAAYEVLGNPDSRVDYDLARAHAHAARASRQSPAWRSPAALAALASAAGAGALMFFVIPSAPPERAEEAAAASVRSPPPQRAGVAVAPTRSAARQAISVAPVPPAPAGTAPRPTTSAVAPSPARIEIKSRQPPVEPKRVAPPVIRVAAFAKPEPKRMVAQKPDEGTSNADLAGLDRHLGILFGQSVRRADAAKQQSLYRDHYRFISRLNDCPTAACKQREYLARMGEVSKTMAAPAKPR